MSEPGFSAHITAAETYDPGTVSKEDILDARAKLKLRDDAVEAVVVANPILKAVHNGTDASPVERHAEPPTFGRVCLNAH